MAPLAHSFTQRSSVAALAVLTMLGGCAGVAPPHAATPIAAAPAQWQAPLPHGGQLADLAQWWSQFDDPLLPRLIDAAQQASPTLASARSRIAQARANRVASGAALAPSLDATAGASRGRQDLSVPLATSGSAGLQAAWEIDLFGARRAGSDAAAARLGSAQAQWHDARVAVAAEVATSYTALRACEAQVLQTDIDARSRSETARLTALSASSGLQSPGNAALSRASAAQGQINLAQQRMQCELQLKSLVALTAIDEASLRRQLAEATARVPQPAQIEVDSVPAQALAQRPDLFSAERDLLAAGADIAQARAQRWPRVTLSGSIARAHSEVGPGANSGNVWSFGPLAVSLPIFDGGTRRANVDASLVRYDEAVAAYGAKLRSAVREVEQALVTLQSTDDRTRDAQVAAEGFHASFTATESRHRSGLASLFELEDARRSDAQAQAALIDLQRERTTAWISLYRALGGGWTADVSSTRTAAITDPSAAVTTLR